MKFTTLTLKGFRWVLRLLALGYLVLWFVYQDSYLTIPNADWTAQLVDCPCEQPPTTKLNDGWAVDIGNLQNNHPGATICYRSYPAQLTSEGLSGQQCCYDQKGQLISKGRAAGTPDRASNCNGEHQNGKMKVAFPGVIMHYFKDVIPSRKIPTETYNKLWKPSECEVK